MFRSMGLLLPLEAAAIAAFMLRRADRRAHLVGRIGLVLDDPKGFESAWRSFVPDAPDFMPHM